MIQPQRSRGQLRATTILPPAASRSFASGAEAIDPYLTENLLAVTMEPEEFEDLPTETSQSNDAKQGTTPTSSGGYRGGLAFRDQRAPQRAKTLDPGHHLPRTHLESPPRSSSRLSPVQASAEMPTRAPTLLGDAALSRQSPRPDGSGHSQSSYRRSQATGANDSASSFWSEHDPSSADNTDQTETQYGQQNLNAYQSNPSYPAGLPLQLQTQQLSSDASEQSQWNTSTAQTPASALSSQYLGSQAHYSAFPYGDTGAAANFGSLLPSNYGLGANALLQNQQYLLAQQGLQQGQLYASNPALLQQQQQLYGQAGPADSSATPQYHHLRGQSAQSTWSNDRGVYGQAVQPAQAYNAQRPVSMNTQDQLYRAMAAMDLAGRPDSGVAQQQRQTVHAPSVALPASLPQPPHLRGRPPQHLSSMTSGSSNTAGSTQMHATQSGGGAGGSSSRSALLEDFRNRRAAAGGHSPKRQYQSRQPPPPPPQAYSQVDTTAGWTLDDIRGHMVEFCMDQHGSRFAQEKLDHATRDQVNWVFDEIRPSARTLMQDVFGNYVVQKMFEYGSNEQRLDLTREIQGHMVALSLGTYGCRVIQKALDYLPETVRLSLAQELYGHILDLVQDQNANHVVQKLLAVLEDHQSVKFISDAFKGRVLTLGAHCYSCRVLQRIFEKCGEEQARPLLEELHTGSQRLMADQYGNYVIQWILQKGLPQDRARVIDSVQGHVLALSRHKFASNVVEQVVRAASPTQLRSLCSEILQPIEGQSTPTNGGSSTAANVMMTDQYANYVLQRFLERCEDDQKMRLVHLLGPRLTALRRGAGGPGAWTKHLAAVERLVGEAVASSRQHDSNDGRYGLSYVGLGLGGQV